MLRCFILSNLFDSLHLFRPINSLNLNFVYSLADGNYNSLKKVLINLYANNTQLYFHSLKMCEIAFLILGHPIYTRRRLVVGNSKCSETDRVAGIQEPCLYVCEWRACANYAFQTLN